MRTAVVDIGSNSTRLLIADVEDARIKAELDRRSTVTRLGAGVDEHGRLQEQAMERVFSTLAEYAAEIERRECQCRVAVLTSAVRDSENGDEFAAAVQERYGLTPHVLSGEQEAQLTFAGATSERDPENHTPTLVFDIGGGSTEMVIGAGAGFTAEVSFHVSTQAGVVRQTERHLEEDPPSEEEQRALIEDVRKTLAEAVPDDQRRAVGHGIGVAGTATSLAAIAQDLDPYDPERVHGYHLSVAECDRIHKRLVQLPLAQRRQVVGLHPDRAPTIIAGVLIFAEVVRLFSLPEIEVSEHDILRGAALRFGAPDRS